MSEPVTHAEIEDVLTSIRRLVSSNGQVAETASTGTNGAPISVPTDQSKMDQWRASQRANGRLVLTPALRVAPTAPEETDQRDVSQAKAASASPVEELSVDVLQGVKPDLKHRAELDIPAALKGEVAENTSETTAAVALDEAEDVAQAPELETQDDVEAAADAADGAEGPAEAHMGDHIEFHPEEEFHPEAEQDTATPVVLSNPVTEPSSSGPLTFDKSYIKPADQPEDHAAEASEPVVDDAPTAEVPQPEDTLVTAPADAPWRDPKATLYSAVIGPTAAPEGGEPAPRPTPSPRVAAVVRRISEIENAHQAGEAVEGGKHWAEAPNEDDTGALPTTAPEAESWAPPSDPERDHAPETVAEDATDGDIPVTEDASTATTEPSAATFSEATVAAVQGQVREQLNDAVEAAVEQALPTRPSAQLPVDEAFLDENSLRDLVAETVRQELQGALGERITRNVRKLVRREIQRALNSQELF